MWQALEAAACADENSRFKKAHAFLSSLRARADVIPPFEFFQEILDHRFGDGETARQRLIRRLGVDADDPISEFMSMTLAYERTSVPTLQGFLEWVAAGDSELKREYDQGRDEVRVMTVHGAKGLQAPIVILPDTCSVPTPRHDPALIGIGDDLVVWPVRKANDVAAITQARQRADENRFAEYYRLFYVAATRAEDRLYVAGHGARDRLDPRAWYALAEAAIVPEAETVALASGETGWRIAQPQSAVSDRDAQPEPSRLTRAPLPVWAHVKAETEAPPVASRAPSAPRTDDPADFGEPAPFSPLAKDDDDRFRRGLIVHKLLEILPQLPRAQRRKAALRRIESAMPAWTGDACDALADEVLGILDDARFASVFGPDSLAEVGLAGAPARLGGIAFGGQVDRLIVEPERVLIVDYKTNRPVPVNVDGVPRLYLQQMAVYRALLQDVYPDRPVHCALLWTAAPSLMALPEQVLDEAKESAIADHP